ncbi:thrombospondin type-1 domain-containing protein 4 [Perognathus longimembris pacificus]|uniref:thrombospondin type-1 domain-containing protein 4 n=1 Tax=Perognathus longimembris pacificus TaxID=214514 RepID=UPI0020189E27|nr:thrombospondin type-1 domain-containing protein 4 [Perognathus longimembris pacificus]
MLPCVTGSLGALAALLLLACQLVCPQPSTEHRKVPQRPPEDDEGLAGAWGSWGPWSACSRSCGGGAMAQTRPCLPRARAPPPPPAPRAFAAGRVVSAVRASVPLLRSPAAPRAHRARPGRPGPGPHERRSRARGPIGPGTYGYGRAPYILPLQTDAGHGPQRLRRQRPDTRPSGARGAPVPRPSRSPAPRWPPQHQPWDHGHSGPRSAPQASRASIFQTPATHDQGFWAASSLFRDPGSSSHHGAGAHEVAPGFPQSLRPTAISCIGAHRQYKLCNTNECPANSRNIREVQCASYNNKPFLGRFYEWEPFAEGKGSRKCELNCQASGYRFYVRQAEKVIDGTPCDQDGVAICVAGQCKSVGCDDYLGSHKVVDKCGVCGGDNTGCRVVSGVFDHALTSLGYHRVLEIPQGATKINVTEMHKSNNYLEPDSRRRSLTDSPGQDAERLWSVIWGACSSTFEVKKSPLATGVSTRVRVKATRQMHAEAGECPANSRNIREVQCASYNNKPFLGRFYEWEPFAEGKGSRKCELNCQASGYRFYVRQAEKVIDGTPCDQDGVAICVAGQCKSVGCDDYLGSHKVVDKCGVCGGDNTGCRVVSGVFDHALTSLGYHRVLEIPQGATKINVTEMHKSNNYLALRSRSGRSIINGNWAIDRPGRYEGGGTMFTYKRPNEISSTAGESFLAEGPTNEILDVYMIHQQPNPGVLYEYVIMGSNALSPRAPPPRRPGEPFPPEMEGRSQEDGDEEEEEGDEEREGATPDAFSSESTQPFPARRPDGAARRSRDYNWKQLGTTECSATCGKGSQYPVFRCVHRNTHEEAPESYCDPSMKPTPEEEPCSLSPCPAYWDIGEWSECSKTCGLGLQHRQVLCRQVFANRSLTVQPRRCQHLEKPDTSSTCQLKICSEWQIRTDWSSCSVPCGVGQRTRVVRCVSNLGDVVADEDCNLKVRPGDIENCDAGPCARSWFLTEWSERCSAECGAGVRTRSVLCLSSHASSLPLEGCGDSPPAETAPCDRGPCVGKLEWFAGSWSQCSVECGSGVQQREVICVRKDEAAFAVLDPHACSSLERPPRQQPCRRQPCGAAWFSTEWSVCSKTCQGGFRVREARCLSEDRTLSDLCDPHLKPEEREACNPQDCLPEVDASCQDKYFNCHVVVQARLCIYQYYQGACCASCTRGARRAGAPGRRAAPGPERAAAPAL